MKVCPRCKLRKSLDDFGAHRGRPDGKANWCLDCARAADRKRRSDPAVRESEAAYARRRRLNPAVKARIRITDAEWKRTHRDHRRSLDRSETKRAAGRAYLATQRGRAAKAAVPCDFTVEDWLVILDRFGHRCAYCLRPALDLQIEHMQPLSRGGAHTKENIVPACKQCNLSKGARSLLEFATVA